MDEPPQNRIRAVYDETTIRVYQAYGNEIADTALAKGTFVSPPFKLERMTWIKPSFLWMMYRCGWGYKDENQCRILAIDISQEGFNWALEHSCPSHPGALTSQKEWVAQKENCPVRIQWDPERDVQLRPLPVRSIQIGLGKEAVLRYVNSWIQRITDITSTAQQIHALVCENKLDAAQKLLPVERVYPYAG